MVSAKIAWTEGTFWFAVTGAGAAALKHALQPRRCLQELTPVALRSGNNSEPSPEALFWGSYAFSAMNFGVFVMGLHAGVCSSIQAKRGFLLGVAALFGAFSTVWFRFGDITKKPSPEIQGQKVAALGLIFFSGFLTSLGET